jgi:hypothetical protein
MQRKLGEGYKRMRRDIFRGQKLRLDYVWMYGWMESSEVLRRWSWRQDRGVDLVVCAQCTKHEKGRKASKVSSMYHLYVVPYLYLK